MDQNSPLTDFGKISKDAVPVAVVLANTCAPEGMQARIFTLIRSILRDEVPDLSGLPAEAVEAIPRLRALDRRSLEMVGRFFGDVGADGDPTSDPTITAIGILETGRTAQTVTREEIRKLIDTFKTPHAPIPTDLSPHGAEAAQIMQLLSEEYILEMEGWFLDPDPWDASSPDQTADD